MQSKAKSVDEYLASLPEDRREILQAVRETILKNLPKGYEEGMQYGMIGYFVPHRLYPAGYHCKPSEPLPFAGLASQKNYMSLHLMCIYGHADHEAWFRQAWQKTGRKLDMGKSCVRFRKLEDVPLRVVGQAVRRVPVRKFIDYYESVLMNMSSGTRAGKKPAGKKTAARRKSAARSGSSKSAAKSGRTSDSQAPAAAGKAAKKKRSGSPRKK